MARMGIARFSLQTLILLIMQGTCLLALWHDREAWVLVCTKEISSLYDAELSYDGSRFLVDKNVGWGLNPIVEVYDSETGSPVCTIKIGIGGGEFSRQGSIIKVYTTNLRWSLFDASTGKEVRMGLGPREEQYTHVSIFRDDSKMLVRTTSECLHLIELKSGRILHSFKADEGQTGSMVSRDGRFVYLLHTGKLQAWEFYGDALDVAFASPKELKQRA